MQEDSAASRSFKKSQRVAPPPPPPPRLLLRIPLLFDPVTFSSKRHFRSSELTRFVISVSPIVSSIYRYFKCACVCLFWLWIGGGKDICETTERKR